MYYDGTDRMFAESFAAARISMNQSHTYAVIDDVYEIPNLHHDGVIWRRSKAIIGPTGTDKTSTKMNTISIIYISSIMQMLHRAWKNENDRTLR